MPNQPIRYCAANILLGKKMPYYIHQTPTLKVGYLGSKLSLQIYEHSTLVELYYEPPSFMNVYTVHITSITSKVGIFNLQFTKSIKTSNKQNAQAAK